MDKINKFRTDQEHRRKLISITAGTLILTGLVVGKLTTSNTIPNILMITAALLAGADISLRAFSSLRSRHISIELLVTIATVGALAIGEYWEAAGVTFLFVFGAYLEARTLSRTRSVLADLLDIAPTKALVIRDGITREVMPQEVKQDEHVLVKPGMKIPVDGLVVEGHSAVDESAITGESMPVEKITDSQVFAGTVNQNGFIKIQTTRAGSDTTLARIIRRVEEAQDEKAPAQRFIERFARWYTPFIIGLSGLAYILTRDLELALTLLVIGCPGALVISTPVSVVSGIGRAARGGILIKGGEYLENAGKLTALALDKTGTLTYGKPRLTDVIPLSQPEHLSDYLVDAYPAVHAFPTDSAPLTLQASRSIGLRISQMQDPTTLWTPQQAEVIYWAAIAESNSEHPLAIAILSSATDLGTTPSPEDFESTTSKGVYALYQGHTILVGTPVYLKESGVDIGPQVIDSLDALKEDGKTSVLVALDGAVIGILGIADTIREAAPTVIQNLKTIGLQKVLMLTGDDRRTALAIAREAGLDHVEAGLLPEDKLDAIRKLQDEGHIVGMVGDGINDAPALAAADIGIAMGTAGTDVAIETADIALMADDLSKITEAINISKATLYNIRQNVAIALLTVGGLLLGVLLGRVHMAGGMLIHEASVLIVILNGMRLLRK